MTTTVYRGGSTVRVIVEPRGIAASAIDVSGHLIITYTDGTTQDLGLVVGGGGGVIPPIPGFIASLKFNDARNSMYAGAL